MFRRKKENIKKHSESTYENGIGCTQIAYLECLENGVANLKADGREGPFSIADLISSCINREVAVATAKANGIQESDITLKKLVEYSDLSDSDKSIINRLKDYMFDWKIIDIHNTKIVNGFYACCIEQSDKKAVVAFRGSESMKFIDLVNDWFRADFALLNSRGTRQQEEAENYGDELIRRKLLDKYDSISVVGHSLGGNLATHFTISMAGKENRRKLFNKISESVNYDGPGFSNEYISAHSDEIQMAASKIKHPKWSCVGDLLFDIPGGQTEFLAINDDLYKDNILKRIKYKTITRHSTKSLKFDENGNVEKGKQDPVSKAFSLISKTADRVIPEWLTIELFAASDWLFDKILKIKNGEVIEFGDISWAERAANNGSVLGKCEICIKNMIKAFKDGVRALRDEFTLNTFTPSFVLAGANGCTIAGNNGFINNGLNQGNPSIRKNEIDKER